MNHEALGSSHEGTGLAPANQNLCIVNYGTGGTFFQAYLHPQIGNKAGPRTPHPSTHGNTTPMRMTRAAAYRIMIIRNHQKRAVFGLCLNLILAPKNWRDPRNTRTQIYKLIYLCSVFPPMGPFSDVFRGYEIRG